MIDIHAPRHDEKHGDGRQAGDLVGRREADVDRLRSFLASARTDAEPFC